MFEKYPSKGGTKVGEQKSATFLSKSASPEYQQVSNKGNYPAKGHAGPTSRHQSREQSRKPFAGGGGGKMVSVTYKAKAHSKFSTEQTSNKLMVPTSNKPKAM